MGRTGDDHQLLLLIVTSGICKIGDNRLFLLRSLYHGPASLRCDYIGKLKKYQIHIKNKTAYLKNMRFSAIIKHRNKREVFLWVYEFCDIFLEPV